MNPFLITQAAVNGAVLEKLVEILVYLNQIHAQSQRAVLVINTDTHNQFQRRVVIIKS